MSTERTPPAPGPLTSAATWSPRTERPYSDAPPGTVSTTDRCSSLPRPKPSQRVKHGLSLSLCASVCVCGVHGDRIDGVCEGASCRQGNARGSMAGEVGRLGKQAREVRAVARRRRHKGCRRQRQLYIRLVAGARSALLPRRGRPQPLSGLVAHTAAAARLPTSASPTNTHRKTQTHTTVYTDTHEQGSCARTVVAL
jgi:hypothetical protein